MTNLFCARSEKMLASDGYYICWQQPTKKIYVILAGSAQFGILLSCFMPRTYLPLMMSDIYLRRIKYLFNAHRSHSLVCRQSDFDETTRPATVSFSG